MAIRILKRQKICQLIKNLYNKYDFLLEGNYLNEDEKKVIILLDEYDSPMHEVYVGGYFIRNLFNSTFKSNPYLERA